MKPKIYTGHLQETASKWLDKHNIEKYILIQFSGGQSALTYTGQYHNINPNRNYPPFLAQQVINYLKEEYPDTAIIDCTCLMNQHTLILLNVICIGQNT
jgi:hypothetical protein